MKIVDKLGFHNPKDHVIKHPEVLLAHLKETIRVQSKVFSDTIRINVYGRDWSSDRVVYFENKYWMNLEEYLKLIEGLRFNFDIVRNISITYTAGITVGGDGEPEDYYEAEFAFEREEPKELFPACEADIITNFNEMGVAYPRPKVEPNNDCK